MISAIKKKAQDPVLPDCPLDFFSHSHGQHNDPISDTLIYHHSLLKSFMKIEGDYINKAIEHFDAFKCKLHKIGIHTTADYTQELKNQAINLCLHHADLLVLFSTTFTMINNEII